MHSSLTRLSAVARSALILSILVLGSIAWPDAAVDAAEPTALPIANVPLQSRDLPIANGRPGSARTTLPIANGISGSARTTLPIANGISGSAGDALPGDVLLKRALPEALIPVGDQPTAAETIALKEALRRYQQGGNREDVSALTKYLDRHPDSPWRVALLTNLGLIYYDTAQFSKALAAFDRAWQAGKPITADGPAKAVVDLALGELVRMHARIGHKEELRQLLDEIKDRPLTGPATERIAGAKEGLWMMDHNPGVAYLCGPKALESIIDRLQPKGVNRRAVDNARSGPKGYSLAQVEALAKKARLPYRMAKRQPGADWAMPAVVHWKVNHYAALIEERDGLLHIKDPTFGGDLWVSRQSLEEEASGYVLVPEGKLPRDYRPVTLADADRVYGRGYTSSSDPNDTRPDDDKAKPCPDDKGMCQYNFHTLLVSLNLTDTPVGYTPPKGPSVKFTATYNQREANQPANFTYANLGAKWTFNWLIYLEDDPAYAARDIKRYVAGGGAEVHTGYNAATQSFAPQASSQSVLVRTSANPVRYELRQPDGSVDVYGQPDGHIVYPRKVFLTEKRDSQGNTVALAYNPDLRITQITDALGQVTTLAYEDADDPYKITRVTDPFGRSAVFAYTGGQLTSITDVLGLQSQFTYGANQFIDSLTTPYGTTTFAYGESGTTRWLEATDPQGDKERLEYRHQAPGIPFSDSIVPQGISPVFNSYINGRNSFYWDKHAMKTAPGDYTQARITHWLHGVNSSVSVGVKESEKQPLENRVWYNYPGQTWGGGVDAGMLEKPSRIGRVLDDGTTQLYQYAYNPLGKTTQAIDPLGRTTVYEYAPDGIDLLRVKQKNGAGYDLLAEFTYDTHHRPLSYQDAAGAITTFTWNAAGQLLTAHNALDETTSYEYDTQGYLLRVVNPLGHTQARFTYDSLGRIATATDESGYTLAYAHDALDRLTQVTYPDGTQRTLAYDKLELASDTDRLGRTTQYAYNPLCQLVRVTDALGRITRYTWCGCGSLESLTDALGQVTTFSHDVQGRTTAKRYADGRGLDYVYEATISRLKTRTDAQGQQTRYRYVKDNALLEIAYPNALNATPTRHFQYDSVYPRLAVFDNGQGITTLSYHSAGQPGAGRLAEETSPDAFGIASGYDALGRPQTTTVIKPDGTHLPDALSYDALGRIIRNDNDLGTFQYAYDADSRRLAHVLYPNQAETQFGYFDALRDFRLKTLNHLDPLNVLLAGNGYTYDAEGQITTWQRTGTETAQEGFTYDAAGQLLEVTTQSGSHHDEGNDEHRKRRHARGHAGHAKHAKSGHHSHGNGKHGKGHDEDDEDDDKGGMVALYTYAYDAAGNRIQETIGGQTAVAAYNNLNQLLTAGAESYAHDPDGNLVERQSANLDDRQYLWDAENRLIAIEDSTNPASRSEFQYDALGRRIGIQDRDNGVLTQDSRLIYCGMILCAKEDRLSGTVTRYYGDGQSREGAGLYYHRDHLGSIRAVTDAAGTLKAAYRYDPYGRQTALLGSAFAVDFGYTGHYVHHESGLAVAPYRAYDADIGRWLSRDPIGEAGGVNLYVYVENNPVNLVDPLGLLGHAPGHGPYGPDEGPGTLPGQAVVGATGDFLGNYKDMRDANTIGADKYFHCKANCEATHRGKSGEATACTISDAREWFDQNVKGDPASASAADQIANTSGRSGANSSPMSCELVCAPFRPNGLPANY
ncbi:RHS repeat-associated core domain-containing protein [Methylocaldum sp.]|uniref:RHS repeat-associated core domain-containing protein n=1 Tax=Methylocaldum sp. TaxID=1969727 RepID=UPI002D5F148A|nr:RHS repeat-associated core domain-containing protein [Methylocaldum sp.]HYE37988.1 RHS repeat-associated core domain-containing protein [Methylocaldum sp.]